MKTCRLSPTPRWHVVFPLCCRAYSRAACLGSASEPWGGCSRWLARVVFSNPGRVELIDTLRFLSNVCVFAPPSTGLYNLLPKSVFPELGDLLSQM